MCVIATSPSEVLGHGKKWGHPSNYATECIRRVGKLCQNALNTTTLDCMHYNI